MMARRPAGVDRIEVQPPSSLTYSSYVLEGLAQLAGRARVTFDRSAGPPGIDPFSLAFVVRSGGRIRRCYVDCGDSESVNQAALAWCDVMGKVNLKESDRSANGIVPIGPTFGIRFRSRAWEATAVAATYQRDRWRDRNYDYHFARGTIEHIHRRARLRSYRPGQSDPDYAFYVSWPWKKHPEVNPPRARFIDACRVAPGLTFEGGFARRRRDDMPELSEWLAPRSRYPIREYLTKVRRSVVAFNNPAVHECLGWKLGEFLALGKAIISYPLGKALPSPLEPGRHLHVVDGTEDSFGDAIDRIRSDTSYRNQLERNARLWFSDHLEPAALARRLLAEMGAVM